MKRRRFLEQLAVTPLVASPLSSIDAATTTQAAASAASASEASKAGTLPPWARPVPEAWANASKAIVLTDMSQCQPASALGTRSKRGRWRVIPYEAEGLTGRLIWASAGAAAPPLRLPLPVKGWHAIFVGLYSTIVSSPPMSLVWLKLDEDMAAQPRASTEYSPLGSFGEAFFKVAELNGGTLQIEQQSAGLPSDGGVVWVKLLPLTREEITGFVADRNNKSTRRLAATNDYGFLANRPTTVEELLREVEMYRDTDFGTLLLHVGGGDGLSYISKYAERPPEGLVYPWEGYRNSMEALRELSRKGINPTKVLIDGAHAMGMKIHVGIRPAAWSYYEPLQEFAESSFYRAHPQWRCVDRDGTPVTRLSWAVPEVRKRLIDVLHESLAWGAEGAHVVFNRGLPTVLYEPAFVELFQKKYGEDPRKLDEETDPRIREAWSEVVTTFMREARAMLDEEQKRRKDGKHLELSAMVFGNEYDNMLYGLDVRRWVAEGLVEEIFSYKWDIGAKKRVDDMKFFLAICQPKGVAFYPSFHPDPKYSTIDEAISWYEQGVRGLAFWDAGGLVRSSETWSFTRFGHADELRLRRQQGKAAAVRARRIRFHRLGDNIMDGRFPPYMGG